MYRRRRITIKKKKSDLNSFPQGRSKGSFVLFRAYLDKTQELLGVMFVSACLCVDVACSSKEWEYGGLFFFFVAGKRSAWDGFRFHVGCHDSGGLWLWANPEGPIISRGLSIGMYNVHPVRHTGHHSLRVATTTTQTYGQHKHQPSATINV